MRPRRGANGCLGAIKRRARCIVAPDSRPRSCVLDNRRFDAACSDRLYRNAVDPPRAHPCPRPLPTDALAAQARARLLAQRSSGGPFAPRTIEVSQTSKTPDLRRRQWGCSAPPARRSASRRGTLLRSGPEYAESLVRRRSVWCESRPRSALIDTCWSSASPVAIRRSRRSMAFSRRWTRARRTPRCRVRCAGPLSLSTMS